MASDPNGKRLYLLDAMALAYRSHFIFINRPLVNSKGENTSATYGFTSALLKLIEDHKIEHIAVVFDAVDEGGTFRDEMYEDYKANREPPPDELIDNIPRIKQVIEAFDIPVFEIAGVEADDVIGTLARKGEEDGADVVIVSPDKDFQQLLSERVTLFRPAYRGEEFDPITVERFREKWGVEPHQFIDIQALWGDSTDNVPGVPGIGEKTARVLIQEYGSVEELLKHAGDIKGKRAREGLLEYPEQARLSKELVSIKTDLDIDLDWAEVHQARPNAPLIRRAFEDLEFSTLLRRTERILGLQAKETGQGSLFSAPVASSDAAPPSELKEVDRSDSEFVLVADVDRLDRLISEFKNVDKLFVDVLLTDADNPMEAAVVGCAVGRTLNENGSGHVKAAYIPLPLPDGLESQEVLERMRPLLESEATKVGHNLKPMFVTLGRSGVHVSGEVFDTMVSHYLCAPEQPHAFEAVVAGTIGKKAATLEALTGKGRSRKALVDVPPAELADLLCERMLLLVELVERLSAKMKEDGLDDLSRNLEFPLVKLLGEIEQTGIRVDTSVLSEISESMRVQLGELEQQIFAAAEGEFNIGSPAQLGEVLFEQLGLPVISKTSTGKASTKESVLQELATQHALPALVLDWRELSKLKSTYVDALPALVNPETGRVHTSFNQTVAATGRLSSQHPNLQNIPIRTARGREIRRAFVAGRGMRLLSADYVQIELRILASMADDPGLKEAFASGRDIHTATAARMFGIEPDAVTRTQRSRAKEVNYGIPYGISAFGLAQRLRCPRAEAQELIDGYNRSYAKVAGFLARQVERVREIGFAETLMGRRRYIPEINARNRVQRAAAERIAFNMPIQGTQADMIKVAMLSIQEQVQNRSLDSRMLLQVHDELVFEVAAGEEDELQDIVKSRMIDALPLEVPVEVELSIADNWLDAH